MYLGIEPATP
ncbi:hypothetical protein EYF80_063210 [Liparis tanakae]|uniref:Uncharacterized protein n=1 Tax=Liparis tanakae TaxID=230148 RepID=A0A4Z2EDT4_9TELE|nr:hypothetical protein EYF80_063210 [Liparis tanakae]